MVGTSNPISYLVLDDDESEVGTFGTLSEAKQCVLENADDSRAFVILEEEGNAIFYTLDEGATWETA